MMDNRNEEQEFSTINDTTEDFNSNRSRTNNKKKKKRKHQ
jgi:hypothetical protein